MTISPKIAITYEAAGVSIDSGNQLVDNIKTLAQSTHRKEVFQSIGGFAGCFIPNIKDMTSPVLVSSTDGVGTKLKIAIDNPCDRYLEFLGIDLVAMCANDLITMGAEPLFFLDYYATGKLDIAHATNVIKGITQGCQIAKCALLGGETAEMPGLYHASDFDLAGFCVGLVDKPKIVDGTSIVPGDKLIALKSNGVHANGFSLVRRLLALNPNDGTPERIDALMQPTKIYVQPVLALANAGLLKGAAHITGGGLSENLPRMLPENCDLIIDKQTWKLDPLFTWLQNASNLPFQDFQRVFNCGVGMVVCVDSEHVDAALRIIKSFDISAWEVGEVCSHQTKQDRVIFA